MKSVSADAKGSSVTTALIYTRVSSEDQAREGMSLDTQLAECRRYAAHQGWLLGTEYTDVLSGTRDDRPQYQQLLADVRHLRSHGASIVVVVAALDRFGRRLLERVRCREELKTLGVVVHSVREGGEVSDLVANVLAAVAQEEVRRLGERVRAARQYVRDHGFQPSGRVPWGYRLRPATDEERSLGAPHSVLEVDDERAPYVRETFRRCAAGQTVRQIARWVNVLPDPIKGGRKLHHGTVARILRSPTYIARPDNATGDVLACPRTRWPALIEDETWQRVQLQIDDHVIHRHQANGQHLLTGYLVCPSCGGLISGRWSMQRRYRQYQCVTEQSRAIVGCSWAGSARQIDVPVLDLVSKILAPLLTRDRTFRTALEHEWRRLQRPDEVAGAREARIARLQRDADRARRLLADAATLLIDGTLDRMGYELARDRHQAELVAAEDEIARLQAAVSRPLLPPLAEVLGQVEDWEAIIQQPGAIAEQRALLAVLVERVEAERVGYSAYGVRVRWTPAGRALAAISGIGETTDLHVIRVQRYLRRSEEKPCVVCGASYTTVAGRPSRYCGSTCAMRAYKTRKRQQRARALVAI